ncbi:MAG: glycosyltransferase family 4 protein [Anaerolineales bacterium]|nr:glycosyltransferase family 4 protein [Anaerolineales bacterium]
MTVCLDLSAAAHERAGLGRYAASLAQALLALGTPLTAFVNDPRESRLRPPLSDLPRRTAGLPRKRWRLRAAWSYFGGPDLRRVFPGISLFHATEHLLPVIPGAAGVFTLHDAAYLRFPEHHLLQNRLYLTLMMPRFLRRAERVICVSEFTRQDALRYYRLDPARVRVVLEGVEPRFQPLPDPAATEAVRARYHLPARFILYVGTLEPRKNLGTLLDAYAALRAQFPEVGLVIAGGKGWLYEAFFERLRASGLEPQVTLTGYVPEDDLPALINCAEVFAYPSVFEGFGLPPLEAMACGVPVVCSHAASLPEVVAEAGVLLPPAEPRAWAEALGRILADPAWRAELAARGRARARTFTWEAAARQTLAIYREAAPALAGVLPG